jgi:hypothetical protein
MKLSPAAERVIQHLKQNEGFITASYARTCQTGVNELLDAAKIIHAKKDDVDGYRMLGFVAPIEKTGKRSGTRRFIVGEGGIHEYNGNEEYKDKPERRQVQKTQN